MAIELKTGKFKPEYISKLDFYLEALDRQVKKANENSEGVIPINGVKVV
ncbi:MAG: DUF1016 family protein [Lachnospiraceae bacterium]|nr:DUF1016 family protein [Lachnospiraceae bacterium]